MTEAEPTAQSKQMTTAAPMEVHAVVLLSEWALHIETSMVVICQKMCIINRLLSLILLLLHRM